MGMYDLLSGRRRDFKRVFMGTEEGQRVLAHIYKMCGMNKQIHSPGDPHSTSFNAGSHRIGQGIQSILGQDEESVMTILKNARSEGDLTQMTGDYDPFETTKRRSK